MKVGRPASGFVPGLAAETTACVSHADGGRGKAGLLMDNQCWDIDTQNKSNTTSEGT